ncbi:CrcB family protein [Bacillus sp. HMF5848]|uniref:fluoride efflux transporter FluC n=1 Tax=Bacillus sp. HMF5848 TaxID=2495421 RepID=UPI000F7907DA|nr:CrcB family protein [Bacillus sp. HMF5848]RSK26835.1 CrcB family protein [Bacillus sp. HMF5848]
MIWAIAGGSIGAMARYITSMILAKYMRPSIGLTATVLVNCTGSALLALILTIDANLSNYISVFLIGICGGFTTFSTFSLESLQYFKIRNYRALLLYISSTLVGSILSFVIAYQMF